MEKGVQAPFALDLFSFQCFDVLKRALSVANPFGTLSILLTFS